ncbi:MAG: hypothetical protein ABIQ31_15220 [Ferruginibacter sp.]
MQKRSIANRYILPGNFATNIKSNARALISHTSILLFFCSAIFTGLSAQKPVIIGFGWDYPDVNQLSKRIDSMQNTPFDGVCFSLQRDIVEVFDTVLQKDAYFKFDQLSSLKWGKYTNNFIFVRGYSKTGGNWFDDKAWLAITANMNNLSKAMLVSKSKGILFDPEYYYENKFYNPWTYNKTQYPNLSFEEVQDKVRERGKQYITALQKYTVDFSFLSIWLTSLIVEDKRLGPLEGIRQALLLSFIEGILLAKNKKVKVIDGDEFAYWYSKPSQFVESVDFLKKNTVELMRSAKGKKLAKDIQLAQPVFYDGILARHVSFERGVQSVDKWHWLKENLKYAIATSTSNMIWFYYERVNWWTDKVNDTLVNILQNTKDDFIPGRTNKLTAPNVNNGKGYYYFTNPKKPMETGEIAFTYILDTKRKFLTLSYAGKLPASLSVFINNTLSISFAPKNQEETIKLINYSPGKLSILAKYEGTVEASALEGY